MEIGGRAFGRELVHEGGAFMNEINGLRREHMTVWALSDLHIGKGHMEKRAVYGTVRGSSTDIKSTNMWFLDLQLSEL